MKTLWETKKVALTLAKCFEEAWGSQGRLPAGDDTRAES